MSCVGCWCIWRCAIQGSCPKITFFSVYLRGCWWWYFHYGSALNLQSVGSKSWGGNRWRNIIPLILSYWHIVQSTCLSLEKWWMSVLSQEGFWLYFLHLLDWSLNWGHLKKKLTNLRLLQMHVDPWFTHAFTLFTDVCCWHESQLRPKTNLVGWWWVLFSPPPRTSSPTFLWFIGFDDVSMRLQTWQQRLMWQKDLDEDRIWLSWCGQRRQMASVGAAMHPHEQRKSVFDKLTPFFFRVLNMCQTQNMNPGDMHPAASLSPAATLGYLRWGPQTCV